MHLMRILLCNVLIWKSECNSLGFNQAHFCGNERFHSGTDVYNPVCITQLVQLAY
ncbi:Uncharacterized protein APZ42_027058 [Daphnia magna]|uniref:Uncharacterized protein n=1 Tax=Daphnia magna TaxID=35525 RepID=A0A164RR87_9CRUS|nr:Uncharacterized protein APZ42_027058 [Daphnia magna]